MPKPLPSNIESGPGQGAGRPGPPGPPGAGFSAGLDLTGSSTEQSVIGFRTRPLSDDAPSPGDAYVFDGTQWVPGPAGGGTVPRLSRYLFVDSGTAVSPGSQDGSIGKPFSTIQAALNVVNAGSSGTKWGVFINPGTFEESLSVSGAREVALISPYYGAVRINLSSYSSLSWTITSISTLYLKGVAINRIQMSSGPSSPPNAGLLYLDDSSALSVLGGGVYETDIIATGPNTFTEWAIISGSYYADGIHHVGGVDAASVELHSTFVDGSVVSQSGTMKLVDCDFDPATGYIEQNGYNQTIYLDSVTWYWVQEHSIVIGGSAYQLEVIESGWRMQPNAQVTSSYNLGLKDLGRCVYLFDTVSTTLFISPRSSVPLPIGCVVQVLQAGLGPITFSPGSGVTISTSSTLFSGGQNSMCYLWQYAADTWYLYGDLAEGGDVLSISGTSVVFSMYYADKTLQCYGYPGTVITLPNASSTVPVGTQFDVVQYSTSPVIFAPADGSVTIKSKGAIVSSQVYTIAQWSRARAKKITAGEWVIEGDVQGNQTVLPETEIVSTSSSTDLSHSGYTLGFNNASAMTYTVEPDSTTYFPEGTSIDFYQKGAGQLTVAQGSGVTIRTPETLKLRKQYSSGQLRKLTANVWLLTGDLELV